MASRAKSNSVAAMVAGFDENQPRIEWPTVVKQHRMKRERLIAQEIFAGILGTRSYRDWTKPHIEMAARLANVNVQADIIFDRLTREGFTQTGTGSKGQDVTARNPLHDVWLGLSKQSVSMAQKLGLSGLPADRRTIHNHASINPAKFENNPRQPSPRRHSLLAQPMKK